MKFKNLIFKILIWFEPNESNAYLLSVGSGCIFHDSSPWMMQKRLRELHAIYFESSMRYHPMIAITWKKIHHSFLQKIQFAWVTVMRSHESFFWKFGKKINRAVSWKRAILISKSLRMSLPFFGLCFKLSHNSPLCLLCYPSSYFINFRWSLTSSIVLGGAVTSSNKLSIVCIIVANHVGTVLWDSMVGLPS